MVDPMQAPAPLPDPRAGPAKEAALVQQMFDRVAPRYDVTNAVLSLGQDRHWRRVATRAVDPRPGERILDVASGTGMLAHELRRSHVEVVALDFSWHMLHTGAVREREGRSPGGTAGRGLRWCAGDALRLPFANATFDAVTIAFGLRNLPDVPAGLRELARVTRPGGRLVLLEFSQPVWAPFRRVYHAYLAHVVPRLAWRVASDPRPYEYLARSILLWPDQHEIGRILAQAGWAYPRWKNLTGGIVACHHALRGGGPRPVT